MQFIAVVGYVNFVPNEETSTRYFPFLFGVFTSSKFHST